MAAKQSSFTSCRVRSIANPRQIKPALQGTIGDTIAVGDTIGLVEVMKSFQRGQERMIGGKIAKFLVENEDAVTAGQPLVEIAD